MRRTRAINNRSFASRTAFSLVEVVAAAAVLGVAMTLTAQLVLSVTNLRRSAREHQIAREEVANVLVELSVAPWETLSAERAKQVTTSAAARQTLASGELSIEIAPVPGEPETRRLVARFSWRNRRGEPQPPVQAVAWVSRTETAP